MLPARSASKLLTFPVSAQALLTSSIAPFAMSAFSSSSPSSSSSASKKHEHDKPVDPAAIGALDSWSVASKDGLCSLAVDRFTETPKLSSAHLPAHHVLDNADILFTHANGYSRYTLRPLLADLRALGAQHPFVAMDFSGHGDSTLHRTSWDWWDHSQDVLSVIQALEKKRGQDKPLIGVGHSMGGAALLMTEVFNPGTFKCIIAIEPVALPISDSVPKDAYDFLVNIALKRKSTFPSFHAAKKQFLSKPAFHAWEERALNEYVFNSLRSDGDGVRLKCAPETEAQNYRMGSHNLFHKLKNITCPVLFVACAESTFLPPDLVPMQAEQVKGAKFLKLENLGHMAPMESPGTVAEAILQFLLQVDSQQSAKTAKL